MDTINSTKLEDLLTDATKQIELTNSNIEINTIVENLIVSVIGSEFASLWVFDENKAVLLRERKEDCVREISMLSQHGVLAKCFLTLTGGIFNYLASEKEYVIETDNPDKIKMKSMIILPMFDGEHLLGIMTAYSSVQKIKNFTEDDKELLEVMMPFLSNIIYRMHPQMKQEESDRVYINHALQQESQSVVEKVTEIRASQKTVETSDATLTFLSNTVHDIRTPANALYGFLELLEEQIDNPRLLQYVENAKESAGFINDLTTSILDRISTQRERKKAEPVIISTGKFFATIAESFSATMSNKEITFTIYIDPLMPKEIKIEQSMLKRVLINLIGNAYKFTPHNKSIDFSLLYNTSKQSLMISIKDKGIGIAKEKQKEIFEAFTQAEEETQSQYGGTGLGLSISAEYVKALGGSLKLESQLEKGSNFYFEIPIEVTNKKMLFETLKIPETTIGILLNQENLLSTKNIIRYLITMGVSQEQIIPFNSVDKQPKTMTHLICFEYQFGDEVKKMIEGQKIRLLLVEEKFLALAKERVYPVISNYSYYANTLYSFISNAGEKRILVVDDDRININLMKIILEEEFFGIDTAMNGESALEMLEQALTEGKPYDMVYLDNYMDKLTGLEVITIFRAFEKKHKSNPIFAVSISGDVIEDTDKVFDTYLNKPFNKKKVKESISEFLNKKKKD